MLSWQLIFFWKRRRGTRQQNRCSHKSFIQAPSLPSLSLTGSAVEAGRRPGGGAVRDAAQQPGEKDVGHSGAWLPGGWVNKGYSVGGFTKLS